MENLNVCWRDIVGNAPAIELLSAGFAKAKTVHAFLLVGPEGVGKTMAATRMAKTLLCQEATGPCGVCTSCRHFAAGSHPDFFQVVPDGQSIKIEQIRRLEEAIALASYMSKRRVVLICEADKMTSQSANALLKTLEEPPGDVVFLLVSAKRRALLDTVLSRCAVVSFHAIEEDRVVEFLVGRGVDQNKAKTAARFARGSIGKALEFLEQDGLSARNKAAEFLESYDMEYIWKLGDGCAEMERAKLLILLEHIETLLRDLLILADDEGGQLVYNSDLAAFLEAQYARWTPTGLIAALRILARTRRAIISNANVKLTMEAFLIELNAKRIERKI